jgi:site-specific recombinase XerD
VRGRTRRPGDPGPGPRREPTPEERTEIALLDAYLSDRRETGWAASPAERQTLLAFAGWLVERRGTDPDRALRAATSADVEAFLLARLREHRGHRGAREAFYRRLLALGRFYVWAVTLGEIPRNPVRPERPPGEGG